MTNHVEKCSASVHYSERFLISLREIRKRSLFSNVFNLTLYHGVLRMCEVQCICIVMCKKGTSKCFSIVNYWTLQCVQSCKRNRRLMCKFQLKKKVKIKLRSAKNTCYISATGRSLVRRSFAGCARVIECDLETSALRPGPTVFVDQREKISNY